METMPIEYKKTKRGGLVENTKARKKRISPLIREACELWASGEFKTIKGLAEHLNCSREHLSKAFHSDHVNAYLQREAKQRISSSTLRAAQVKVGLLEADSEHVRSQVASEILAMGGIQAPKESANTTVNVGVSVGYVVRLDDRAPDAPTITVNATRDTGAT